MGMSRPTSRQYRRVPRHASTRRSLWLLIPLTDDVLYWSRYIAVSSEPPRDYAIPPGTFGFIQCAVGGPREGPGRMHAVERIAARDAY